MQPDTFIEQSKPFIQWMLDWKAELGTLSLSGLIDAQPEKVGIICVDLIKGFCTVGPLSSPRVNSIVTPIVTLLGMAWEQGLRDFALPHDTHPDDAVEFNQYGAHCISGTEEVEVVNAIKALPFFENLTVIDKNCINAGLNKGFITWLDARPHIHTWIIVGDCTDICTYQLALHLRANANEQQRTNVRVIVPANMVETYDLPVKTAQDLEIIPHDGNFLHLVFLYHMMLNGIEIYSEITE
jgi:nicotinamidase-related amidase